MKVTVRPMKGTMFEVEAEPEESIEDLKRKIAAQRDEFPVDVQKLVHAGKVLAEDRASLQDLGIKPGTFVVVMAGKARRRPAAAGTGAGNGTGAGTGAAAAGTDAVALTAPPVAVRSGAVGAAGASAGAAAGVPAGAGAAATRQGAEAQPVPVVGAAVEGAACTGAVGGGKDPAAGCPAAAAGGGGYPSAPAAAATVRAAAGARPAATTPTAAAAAVGADVAPAGAAGGGGDEAAVGKLVALGFSRERARDAYVRSGRNAELAASILFDDAEGEDLMDAYSPPAVPSPAPPPLAAGATTTGRVAPFPALPAVSPVADGYAAGDSPAVDAYLELRNDPSFEQLAQMVAQNPQVLGHIVQGLHQTHPELAQTITDHEEEFLDLVLEHVESQAAGEGAVDVVNLTPEDEAAVSRLAALGFEPEAALEAYVQSGYDEELASSVLFGDTDLEGQEDTDAGMWVDPAVREALRPITDDPSFAQLAQMVTQSPSVLQQVVHGLAQSRPDLAQIIANNEEAFLLILSEAAGGGPQQQPGLVDSMIEAAQAPTIELTADDEAAVERLAGLGFDRAWATEVYLGADRNENLAANILFEDMSAPYDGTGATAAADGDGHHEADDAIIDPAMLEARQLSADDEAAVQRLVGLGFDTDSALQAYLDCGMNEELAAGYLFEDADNIID